MHLRTPCLQNRTNSIYCNLRLVSGFQVVQAGIDETTNNRYAHGSVSFTPCGEPMQRLETSRLSIRPFALTDAALIVTLLNEPTFIENIADKGVRTVADAQAYLRDGPLASYEQNGFGLCLVSLKDSQIPIGMCGLLQRDYLDMADIGYALFPQHCGSGYACEACCATLSYARDQLKLPEIAAIVNRENTSSIRLLDKLGFHFQKLIQIENESKEVRLYLSKL